MYKNNNVPFTTLLLATLASGRSTKHFREIISRSCNKSDKENYTRLSLYRLAQKKFITQNKLGWKLTNDGRRELNVRNLNSYLISPFLRGSTNSVIVSFDIPEQKRKMRYWLRNQLKIFGYQFLQQSLWIGPGPLPNEFLHRLGVLNIRKNVKILKISRKIS